MSVRPPAGRTSPVRGSCNRGGVRPGARYQPRASACSHAARNRKGTTGMAPVVTMRQLLESGVHFGHQTRRWNPKMKRFILAERNGIYIIDLQQSLDFIDNAYEFIKETVAHGGTVLYVGTKKQAQEAVAEQARRVGMPFVNQRWLGGMLTNFTTVFKPLPIWHGALRRHEEAGPGSGRRAGPQGGHAVREPAVAGRHADQLHHGLQAASDLARCSTSARRSRPRKRSPSRPAGWACRS